MARTIAVANEKGGAGKTTTAANLAAALAEVGERVLVADLDARADLTLNLGVRLGTGEPSVYALFGEEGVRVADVVRRVEGAGIDVAPAERDLAAIEVVLGELTPEERRRLVDGVLRKLERGYGWVLLDCPPGLSRLVVAVLQCVDWVLVPQQCSFTALHGLRALEQTLADIRATGAPRVPEVRIALTMAGRTLHSRRVEDVVRSRFGEAVFTTTIPSTVRLQEAPEYGVSVLEYDPQGKGAEAYRALAQEVIRRAT